MPAELNRKISSPLFFLENVQEEVERLEHVPRAQGGNKRQGPMPDSLSVKAIFAGSRFGTKTMTHANFATYVKK